MSPTRPARCAFSLRLFLLVVLGIQGGILFSQELSLPDFVLPRRARPDIPLPEKFPDPAEDWIPSKPLYRRLYPLTPRASRDSFLPLPEKFIQGDLPLERILPIGLEPLLQEELPRGSWLLINSLDPREGLDSRIQRNLSKGDSSVGAGFFIPFSSPLPWSGYVDWQKGGFFAGKARLGIRTLTKSDGRILPFFEAGLSWERGPRKVDSYSFQILGIQDEKSGLDLSTNLDFLWDLPLSRTWKLTGNFSLAGWNDGVADNSLSSGALFRTALALGWGSAFLSLFLGGDFLYDTGEGFKMAPRFRGTWDFLPDWNLRVDGQWQMGYPESLVPSFFKENVESFQTHTPVFQRYRLVLTEQGRRGKRLRFSVDYSHGRFALGDGQGKIITQEDQRIGGSLDFTFPFRVSSLSFKSSVDFSLNNFASAWQMDLRYHRLRWALYTSSGSADMMLGSALLGIRAQEPIIGLGLRFFAFKNWEGDIFGYIPIPGVYPSLRLLINWSAL